RYWPHGAIHAVAAALFPVFALGGVALYHRVFLGATAPIVDVVGELLQNYAAQDILGYLAIIGLVHAFQFRSRVVSVEERAEALQAELVARREEPRAGVPETIES